jgi:hypothetical protein
MSDFVWKTVFGITLFLFGLRIFLNPRWYAIFRSYHVDFSDHNHLWGVVWMLGGIVLTWIVVRDEMKKRKKKRPQ